MKIRLLLIVSAFVLTIVAGLWLSTRPWETPADRAVRLCEPCGMPEPEVLLLIQDIRASGQTREQAIKVWEQTYTEPDALAEARTMCGGCVGAIVDAVEQTP